jgi:SAM-dependent MidA family methyltransferase
MDAPRPWREAWQSALYAVDGFYSRPEGPAGHFTTAAHGPTGALLAAAVGELADREGCNRVVDLGCGRGELLHHLAEQRPDLVLTGVDVVARPEGLPEEVHWLVSPGGAGLPDALRDLPDTLVVANEWLDVVPCTIARFDGGRLREVLVDTAGRESLGGPVGREDAAWVERWWPRTAGRVEVGRQRDDAWDDLLSRIGSGAALAVDYGHLREDRPALGSLQAYARGVLTEPVPDGSCDLTAHVAVDSLTQDRRTTQREALAGLVTGPHPDASSDPHGHLHSLARASALGALRDPGGLGAFHWVHRRV